MKQLSMCGKHNMLDMKELIWQQQMTYKHFDMKQLP